MTITKKHALLGGVAMALVLTAAPAMAEAPASDDAHVANEITVTARRREESILKVPVVASVLSSEELVRTGTGDLSGISAHVPGLNLGTSVSSFGTQVSLRGIGTSTLNASIDQSVSLNIDGMQITQGLSYAMGFFDVGHVEVLKGPQALFYGKASPAGVISIRSADPTDEFEVIARAGYEFEAREARGELVVSGPLSDTLKARVAASYADGKGFFHNVGSAGDAGTLADINPTLAPFAGLYGPLGSLGGVDPHNSRVPGTTNLMLRGTLLWEPTSDFTARFKVSHGNMKAEGSGFDVSAGSCPDGVAPSKGIPYLSPADNCKVDRKIYSIDMDPAAFPGIFNNGVPYSKTKQTFGTLDLNYNVAPDLTLSSLTGYFDLKQSSMTNGSQSSFAGPPFVVQGIYKRHDFTQELRLTSDYSGPVNFMLGGFYQHGKQNFFVDLPTNTEQGTLFGFLEALSRATDPLNHNFDPITYTIPAIMANVHGYASLGLPPTLSQGRHLLTTDAYSVFGQALWKFAPNFELGVGARWTDETRKDKQINLNPFDPYNPLGVTNLAVPKIHSSNVSPEISLTYTPTDTLTLFANLKQAYKSGSFITSGIFSPGDDNSFGDERVRGGEAGIKTVMLDGDLNLNLAGYYYKYKGLQVGSNEIEPSTQNIIIYTRNAAGAKAYGIDFDTRYSPSAIQGLTLTGAVSWNIAKFTSFTDAPCWGGQTYDQGCNLDYSPDVNLDPHKNPLGGYTHQDLSGRPMSRAPKWSIIGNVNYDMPLKNDMTLGMGLGGQYTAKYLTNILDRDDMWQKGIFKLNANIALRGKDDRWELALIGNNLTNKIVSGNCINSNIQDGHEKIAGSYSGYGGGLASGVTSGSAAGVQELLCALDPGRSVQLRVTLKM